MSADLFYSLTPDHILDAVEKIGWRSTGRCFALNSVENRVYEVELEDGQRVIGKFYRPGRWSKECILEEHQFTQDLAVAEVPVALPMTLSNGSTLDETDGGIYFAVFPKIRGRSPQELKLEELTQLGRFVARLHNVGVTRKATHRLQLNPEVFGTRPLKNLVDNGWLPLELKKTYQATVEQIITHITPWFENVPVHRIHGDCHLGNLLQNADGFFFVDFDDMVVGPAVQDMWLMTMGQGEEAETARRAFLTGYEEMREFDHSTLRLIEPLRALRIVNYSSWIASRWKDPAFPLLFPEFNTHKYWQSETLDLELQWRKIKELS